MDEIKLEKAGVGEKLQYLAHEQNDNTVRLELSYPDIISEDIMGKAVLAVVQGIDVLHSTFVIENGKAFWKENTDVTIEDCFAVKETEEDPVVLADQAILCTVAPENKVQLFCTLINGKGKSALSLIVSHLCVDGGDAKYLLEKIAEAYNLFALEGSAEKLQLKTGSRSSFQVYEDLNKKDIFSAFKPSEMKGKSPFPFANEEAGTRHLVKYMLNRELVGKLKQYGKAKGVTLNDLLLTAFYRAYIELPGAETDGPVAIMSMMDLRRHRKSRESDGLANMSGTMPTLVENSIHGSFEETLEELAAQTKASKDDPIAGLYGLPMIHLMGKMISLNVLVKKMGAAYKASPFIGMTNLGNLSCEKLTLNGICPTEAACGGPLKKKPGMQISVIGIAGTIALNCIGEYTDSDEKVIRLLMENIIRQLQAAAYQG